jgi:hypothetical protein
MKFLPYEPWLARATRRMEGEYSCSGFSSIERIFPAAHAGVIAPELLRAGAAASWAAAA